MDLKTGKINVDRCHISITHDFTEYVKKSYQIFIEQKIRYAEIYPDSNLVNTMEILDKNKLIVLLSKSIILLSTSLSTFITIF